MKARQGVGFGVPFFVSGLDKFMGKLADRICFGVQGPRGLGLGCRSLCLAFISLWELADRIFFGVQGPRGWVWGAVLCVWPACKSL